MILADLKKVPLKGFLRNVPLKGVVKNVHFKGFKKSFSKVLFHHVQQKASEEEEEVGRSDPGLFAGQRSVKLSKEMVDQLSDGERSKLSDQGDKERGEVKTGVKKAKHEGEEVVEEVNEDLVARRDMSRHGQGDKYVGDDLRDRKGEGIYKYKQGGSNMREEGDEGGWFSQKQLGSSIASTIEPEQVRESHSSSIFRFNM